MIPFSNLEPKDSDVYQLITTKPGERKKQEWFCIKKRRVEARLIISGSLVLPDIVFQITQTRFVVVNKRLRVFCIRKADNIAVFGFMKADKARISATAVTAGKAVTAVLEISCVPFRFCGQVLFICGVSFCASRKRQPAPHRRQSATQPTIQGALLRGQLARGSGCCPVLR